MKKDLVSQEDFDHKRWAALSAMMLGVYLVDTFYG